MKENDHIYLVHVLMGMMVSRAVNIQPVHVGHSGAKEFPSCLIHCLLAVFYQATLNLSDSPELGNKKALKGYTVHCLVSTGDKGSMPS